MKHCTKRSRLAMSMIEVIVVIAIIAIVIAFVLPAVQKVRSASQRAACENNLRQLGLAFHNFHEVHSVLPSHGGGVSKPVLAIDGSYFTPTVILRVPPYSVIFMAVGDPLQSPARQQGSWIYSLLPFVEQENAFREVKWGTPLQTLTCPARRRAVALVPENDEYGDYVGGGWAWAKTDYACNGHLIRGMPFCRPLSFVTDGTTNTILVGEKALNPMAYDASGWFFDEPYFLGGALGNRRKGINVLMDGPDYTYVDNWGSAHLTGPCFLFSDGSVRTLSYGISVAAITALLTPDGGEITPDP